MQDNTLSRVRTYLADDPIPAWTVVIALVAMLALPALTYLCAITPTQLVVQDVAQTSSTQPAVTPAAQTSTLVVVHDGDVPDEVWDDLYTHGARGIPGDGMEALYVDLGTLSQVMGSHGLTMNDVAWQRT